MKRGGLDLSISTIVILVLAVFVLIGLILFLNQGFEIFKKDTGSALDSLEYKNFEKDCLTSCLDGNKKAYCCTNVTISEFSYVCKDTGTETCALDCFDFIC